MDRYSNLPLPVRLQRPSIFSESHPFTVSTPSLPSPPINRAPPAVHIIQRAGSSLRLCEGRTLSDIDGAEEQVLWNHKFITRLTGKYFIKRVLVLVCPYLSVLFKLPVPVYLYFVSISIS